MLSAVIINLLCWVASYWMLLCQMSWHPLWRFKAILFYEMETSSAVPSIQVCYKEMFFYLQLKSRLAKFIKTLLPKSLFLDISQSGWMRKTPISSMFMYICFYVCCSIYVLCFHVCMGKSLGFEGSVTNEFLAVNDVLNLLGTRYFAVLNLRVALAYFLQCMFGCLCSCLLYVWMFLCADVCIYGCSLWGNVYISLCTVVYVYTCKCE
jgi:hypothetical protein